MLKVGIVGCGKIADAHASQIQRIKGCEIVAVCDREPLMAQQLYERFPVRRYFADLDAFLDEARPDAVHITTPPAGHFEVAKKCIEKGCSVFIEKPVTLYAEETRILLDLANEKGVKVTAGHDDQYSHVARRMRALIRDGYLGGTPVHMESSFCYDLSDPEYARAFLSDRTHWVRRLPGKLLQNIISHGIARIAEFLSTDSPRVTAQAFCSPLLRQLGEAEIFDELRVLINEDDRTTAYFTFSSHMRPNLHEFRIYGPKNGLIVNQDQEMLLKLRGQNFKSYGEKFVPSLNFAAQHLGNFATNFKSFLKADFHMKTGLKYLIEAFYRSIEQDTPVPIPYREILLTARIMDAIFEQVADGRSANRDHERAPVAPELADA